MKQTNARVAPSEMPEATVMTVWPSICAYPSGRFLGRLYTIPAGIYVFTLGNLLALASIPHALALYVFRILPFTGMRYQITNRRIVVQRGLMAIDDKSVELDRFDRIDVQVQPGQEWFKAGDLVFFNGSVETFRLDGVSRPHVFRATCMKSRTSFVGVQEALEREAAKV